MKEERHVLPPCNATVHMKSRKGTLEERGIDLTQDQPAKIYRNPEILHEFLFPLFSVPYLD